MESLMNKNICFSFAILISISALAESQTTCYGFYGVNSGKTLSRPTPTNFAEYRLQTVEPIEPLNRAVVEISKKLGLPVHENDTQAFEKHQDLPSLIDAAVDFFPDKNNITLSILKRILNQIRYGQDTYNRPTSAEFLQEFIKEKVSIRETSKILAVYGRDFIRYANVKNDHYMNKSISIARHLGLLTDGEFNDFMKLVPNERPKHNHAVKYPEEAAKLVRTKIVQAHVLDMLLENRILDADTVAKEVVEIRKTGAISKDRLEMLFAREPSFNNRYGHITGSHQGRDAAVFTTFDMLHLPEFRQFLLEKKSLNDQNAHNLVLLFDQRTQFSSTYSLFPSSEYANPSQFPEITRVVKHILELTYKEETSLASKYHFTSQSRENSWDGGQLRDHSQNLATAVASFIAGGKQRAIDVNLETDFDVNWTKVFENSPVIVKRFLNQALAREFITGGWGRTWFEFFPETLNVDGAFSASEHTNKVLSLLATASKKTNREVADVFDSLRDKGYKSYLAVELTEFAITFNKTVDQIVADHKESREAFKLLKYSDPSISDILGLSYITGLSPKEVGQKIIEVQATSSVSQTKVLGKLAEISIILGKPAKELDLWFKTISDRLDTMTKDRRNSNYDAIEVLEAAALASKLNKTSLRKEVLRAEKILVDFVAEQTWISEMGNGPLINAFRHSFFQGIKPETLYPFEEGSIYRRKLNSDIATQFDFSVPARDFYIRSMPSVYSR